MSQKEHSRAHRRRTYKRVRGVILILLVLGIIWGITALVRHNAAQPDPPRIPMPVSRPVRPMKSRTLKHPILILTPNRPRILSQPPTPNLIPSLIPSLLPTQSLPGPT